MMDLTKEAFFPHPRQGGARPHGEYRLSGSALYSARIATI